MRYIHRNQWDTRGIDLVCEHWSDMLIDSKFNHQIPPVARQLIHIVQGGGAVVTIVENDQINAGGRGSGFLDSR
jgi:hypothetical protein